jgi:hypothetical protein
MNSYAPRDAKENVTYPGIRMKNNFIAVPRELAKNALLLFRYIATPQNVERRV